MDSWVDETIGRRVTRLSRREGKNLSFYFHNNPFFPGARPGEGDKMVFVGKTDHGFQYFAVNLSTGEIEQITEHAGQASRLSSAGKMPAPQSSAGKMPVPQDDLLPRGRQQHLKGEILSLARREVFYCEGGALHATHVDTHATRTVVEFPEDFRGRPSAINCDGTFLVGSWAEGGKEELLKHPRSVWFKGIFHAHMRHHLFTIDAETGEMRDFYEENAWLNHLQFSPTDPTLLMFCHEGPWHLLDRIWLIRTDGTDLRQIHKRTVENEIWGHEFWHPDGRSVWFDLQIPKGERFFVAGVDLATDRETRYEIERDEWSVHFNISRDGRLFCGDGGDEKMVAKAPDGKWIYLFRPNGERMRSDTNRMKAERLCSMAAHDYALEPNVHFTPDMKRVVFRSNMHGTPQVYAVEIDAP